MVKRSMIMLPEDDMPTKWYNINPDLPRPPDPPLHPAKMEPVGPDDLAPLFPMALIGQEVSAERYIDIPEEVQEIYRRYRPSPLFRAHRLENALKTKCKIFYKYEGNCPPGSHKPNTAIAQAYFNMKEGIEHLTTETGAGQWGTALAYACTFFDIDLRVFMVRVSYDQKPYRRTIMQLYGANVWPSPSDQTNTGKKVLEENPDHPGSLGLAISEAIEACVTSEGCKYSIGSALGHVLLHQTIMGQEAKEQLALVDEYPDYVAGCVGGGSNFAGISYPFIQDKLKGDKPDLEVVAAESDAAPKLTRGKYLYDFGDTANTTPLLKMLTIGSAFIPAPVHAGGLRYHGSAPSVALLVDAGVVGTVAYAQTKTFEDSKAFTLAEGIVPAPESGHAVSAAMDYARKHKDEEKTILFNLSGHGLLDLLGYEEFLSGKMKDYSFTDDDIKATLSKVPPQPQ